MYQEVKKEKGIYNSRFYHVVEEKYYLSMSLDDYILRKKYYINCLLFFF